MKPTIKYISKIAPFIDLNDKVLYYLLMKDSFLAKVRNYILTEKLIEKGDRIVIGVSGGADSVALFKVLAMLKTELSLELNVITVNHGLRAEAISECEYVESLCREENILFSQINVNVSELAAKWGVGTEEAGRKVRYRAFEERAEALGEGAKIAVAHNQNDSAETMLFHLFRGTGPRGLASIRPKRGNVIRPLLCVTRSEIEKWLCEKEIRFYTDASNLTDEYTRNKIRHHILEYAVSDINSNAVEHMSETAASLNELVSFADEAVELEIEKRGAVEDKSVLLNLEGFDELNLYIKKALIKRCIDILVPGNRDITLKHLESVLDILNGTESKSVDLPYSIVALKECETLKIYVAGSNDAGERSFDSIVIKGESGEALFGDKIRIKWRVEEIGEGFEVSKNQYTKCFDYDKITHYPVVRFPREGDYLTINAELQKKKLSDYFIDEKIPKSLRDSVPLVADDSHVWWVIGHRISEYPKVTENTKKILYIEVVC